MRSTIIFVLTFIISSTSIAQNWNVLFVPQSVRYDDIYFINEDIGWAVDATGSGTYKSTDGGQAWVPQHYANGDYLRSVVFLDENVGFVGSLTPNFRKTTDGGQTYEILNIPGVEGICGLDAVGTDIVYGCGAYFGPAYIIKSTDAGESWDFIDLSAYATGLVEVLFIDENIGFTSGKNDNGGTILKTTDGGQSWTEIYNTGIPGEMVWKMQQLFSNSDAYFASIQSIPSHNGKVIKSLDSGQTWSTHEVTTDTSNPTNNYVQGVGFITENHGWASGYDIGLLETLDGGLTWTDISNGLIGEINRFQVFSQDLVYASGGSLYKYTNTLGINEPTIQTAERLTFNVSPNPLVDELNISIIFQRKDHIVITLFDEQGRLIEQLARETIGEVGEQKFIFDFPYPSGVYFLQLHNDVGLESAKIIKN